MKQHRRHFGAFLSVGLVLLSASSAPAAGWWNYKWPYRRAVEIPPTKRSGLPGDDVAVVTMPTGGKMQPDGGDIRVATAAGKPRTHRVLMVGPGDFVRVAFAIRPGVRKYYVYFGNAEARKTKAPKPLEIRRGVLLETWKYPGGGLRKLEQVKTIFTRTTKLLGRDFRQRIFLGHNPFGPQSAVAGTFTAWLKCPADGQYTFALSSRDASFLLVDDKLIVNNGGRHRPQRDVRKRGRIELKAGLHKLTVYHVSLHGDPIVVAAWRPPGNRRIWTIPPGAFAPVARATPGAMERYARAVSIDFLPSHAGEAFMRNRYYQRYAFTALAVKRSARGLKWQWDFGDGQKATGQEVEHVYLLPGEYTVTLSARTRIGVLKRTNRIFVSRPWGRVTLNRLDSLKAYAEIVGGYDFNALRAAAAGEAILLFSRTGRKESLLRAGEALVAHEEAPAKVLDEAMELYAGALVASGRADRAVAALEKSAKMAAKAPAVAASLLVRAGEVALAGRDTKAAMRIFDEAIRRYAVLTTSPAIRGARIGIGDVWRARGEALKARKAYAAAKVAPLGGKKTRPIVKGDLARHVEEYLRERRLRWAQEYLDRWAKTFPADKLEGYWSLLQARVWFRQKRYAAAAGEVEILVRVTPTSNYAAELLVLSADAYDRLKEPDKAAAALKRVVEKYPESPLAAKAAEKLKKQ